MADKRHYRTSIVPLLISVGTALVIAFFDATTVRATEPPQGKTRPVATSEPELPPGSRRVTEKQVKAYSGLAALVGIVIAGLGLAALNLMWARRLRRELRKPMPECETGGRDFWFLKPPKPTARDSTISESHLPPHDTPPPAE